MTPFVCSKDIAGSAGRGGAVLGSARAAGARLVLGLVREHTPFPLPAPRARPLLPALGGGMGGVKCTKVIVRRALEMYHDPSYVFWEMYQDPFYIFGNVPTSDLRHVPRPIVCVFWEMYKNPLYDCRDLRNGPKWTIWLNVNVSYCVRWYPRDVPPSLIHLYMY